MAPHCLPDNTPLLRHLWVLSGHSCQEAGGASPLGTSDTDKVPGSHHIAGGLCGYLMGDHRVLADLLENLENSKVKHH